MREENIVYFNETEKKTRNNSKKESEPKENNENFFKVLLFCLSSI